MQEWSLSHHRDEPFSIHLREKPLWTWAIEQFADTVDVLLGHNWCSPPEWLHKIPVGRPEYDSDGFLERSVGSLMFTSFQRVSAIGFHRETRRHMIPITRSMAEEIDPETTAEWVELFDLDSPG
jgi:hypothetical protein